MGLPISLVTQIQMLANRQCYRSAALCGNKSWGEWEGRVCVRTHRNTRTRNNSLASLACNVHTDLEILAVLTFGLTQEGLEKNPR